MAKIGNQGDGGGRKTIVFDDDKLAKIEALAACLSIDQIADYFGIGKTTIYQIMKRQPEVEERYKIGKSKAIASIGSNLISQARSGNTAAAMFYLKTRAGWKETTVVENDNKNVLKVNVNLKNDQSE
jgi:hypothetical protein